MTREEAINKWIVPAIKNTWNEKKCNEILKALEQEPCDCITLRLEKGTLKYSEKDYVVYKKEWLKKWWQPELALLGIQPKEIYNKGWKDGAKATAYHVELCDEENPTIPLSVIGDIKAELNDTIIFVQY